jgi:hypothetical protein
MHAHTAQQERTLHCLSIIAVTCMLIFTAYGLIRSAITARIDFELQLILFLIVPAISLPAIAFHTHLREKERANTIIEAKNTHLDAERLEEGRIEIRVGE